MNFRQLMDQIYRKNGVRYQKVHIYRLLNNELLVQKYNKKICQYWIKQEQNKIQKGVKRF